MSEIDGVFVDNTAVAGNRRCWAECSLPYAGIHTPTNLRWRLDGSATTRYVAMQTGRAVAVRHKICEVSISEERRE